jgi:hypothetical protein
MISNAVKPVPLLPEAKIIKLIKITSRTNCQKTCVKKLGKRKIHKKSHKKARIV